MKTNLTVDQMNTLDALGVDISDASFLWMPNNNDYNGTESRYTLSERFCGITTERLEEEYPMTMKGVQYSYSLDDVVNKVLDRHDGYYTMSFYKAFGDCHAVLKSGGNEVADMYADSFVDAAFKVLANIMQK